MALRYLAGGSYLDIMYLHGVSKGAFYKHLWSTLEAMDKGLPDFTLADDIKDLDRCRYLAAGFSRRTDGHIQGAIAAWDGIIFKVEKPSSVATPECPNPNKFHCRKGFPGVSCQACCDADNRFLWAKVDFAASVHDARAYRMSQLAGGGARMSDLIENSEVMGLQSSELEPRRPLEPISQQLGSETRLATTDK